MRQKRAKAYKRLMSLYSQTFGFRTPFQVLVTHDFLLELANMQLDVAKQLTNCVQAECKPMITQCSIDALYKLGKEYQHVVDIAKTFERRRCNHREPLPEFECITEVVGPTNKHRYTMAMQSNKLRTHMRKIPGVPCIHFNERSVMVMEMPTEATLKKKDEIEKAKMTEQLETHPILDNVITGGASSAAGPSTIPARSRKAGPKAPNSLSSKKKGEKQTGRLSKKELAELAEKEERRKARAQAKKAAEQELGESHSDEEDDDEVVWDEAAAGAKRKRGAEADSDDEEAEPKQAAVAPGGEAAPSKKHKKRKRRRKGAAAETAGGDDGQEEASDHDE